MIGFVPPGSRDSWLGGFHLMRHLLFGVASLPTEERIEIDGVWWGERPEADVFAEFRPFLAREVSLGLPRSIGGRAIRRLRRLASGRGEGDLRDIFGRAGIRAIFPCPPCDRLGIPLVFWISDLQYYHLPHYYVGDSLAWFQGYNVRHGAEAARIMVTGEAVLADLKRFLPQFAGKARLLRISSVPDDTWWREDPDETRRRMGLPDRYFVVSNQVCAHKNHATVFEAMRVLKDRGLAVNVLCTGRTEDYRDPTFFPGLLARVSRLGIESQVRFLGALPRSEHIAVLRGAVALLQPSEFEGWGLAVSDAKAIGKPILVSDLPAHREHQHPRAVYLPPRDAEAWADAMSRASKEYAPGPDHQAEAAAQAAALVSARQTGIEAVRLFREVLA